MVFSLKSFAIHGRRIILLHVICMWSLTFDRNWKNLTLHLFLWCEILSLFFSDCHFFHIKILSLLFLTRTAQEDNGWLQRRKVKNAASWYLFTYRTCFWNVLDLILSFNDNFDDKVFHAGLRWDSYGLWCFQIIKNVYGYSNLNSHDRHAHKMHWNSIKHC